MRRQWVRSALTAAAAAGAARSAYGALRMRPPGGEKRWSRTNHRGEPVTLLEGPAAAAGCVTAAALAPGAPGRARTASVVAGIGTAAFGALDDLMAGRGEPKGFRGHLGALRRGEVTTGAVKLGGIGVTGLVSAAALGGSPADVAVNAGLISGSANLLNLFDLRPGRAIKVAVAVGAALCSVPPRPAARGTAQLAAAPAAAAAALAGPDLGERAMLGDAGANALGSVLGAAAAAGLSRGARIALLAGITGLTAASEVVSFTRVIEKTPPLHRLDMLGRRPAGQPAPRPDADRPDAHRSDAAGDPAPDAAPDPAPDAGSPDVGPRAEGPPDGGSLAGGSAWSSRSKTSA